RSGHPAARIGALKVLRRVGWESSQPQIDEMLRDLVRVADADTALKGLTTLATWGRPNPSEIRELLRRTDAGVGMRRHPLNEPAPGETAVRGIIRLGRDAAGNLNDVLELLAEEPPPWDLALPALRAMQNAARPAAPRLLKLLDEFHDYRQIDVG